MTTKQKEKVAILIERFAAESHKIIEGDDTWGPDGLPVNWVMLALFRDGRRPYVFGISPEGNSHS